jgi:hypothetical protein
MDPRRRFRIPGAGPVCYSVLELDAMTDRDAKIIDIAAELRHETARAYLVHDGRQDVWLPKSLVEYDERDKVFTMPEWLAQDKGLI